MVCGCNGVEHQSCELSESGIRMCRPGREAKILGSEGATCNTYFDILNDRLLRGTDASLEAYTNAGTVRGVPLYGSCITERTAILRQDLDNVYATEVSARSYVFKTGRQHRQQHRVLNVLKIILMCVFLFIGSNTSSPCVHSYSADLSSRLVGHKVVLYDINSFPPHAGSNDRDPKIVGLDFHASRTEDFG